MMNKSKPVVFIISTGLGHVNRGYESFTKECFSAIKNSEHYNIFLLKGGGRTKDKEIKINCIRRKSYLADLTSKLLIQKDKYVTEQATFLLGMIPYIIWFKPSLLYYSDIVLGKYLWHLRKHFKLKYKLLFSNGAPLSPPFIRMDHVQQLLPNYIEIAKKAGTPLEKQTLLPYAINIDENLINKYQSNKIEILNNLKLPLDKKIIICVGAINSDHKRIDYLINEFSTMKNEDFFLIVLGQIDEMSLPIIQLAKEKLKNENYLIRQVNGEEVQMYLSISDYFILPSLNEGLPRVLPEALSTGLLPIVHDYTIAHETLKDYGVFKNLTQEGILGTAINDVDTRNISKEELKEFAKKEYSWDSLKKRYEQMIVKNL